MRRIDINKTGQNIKLLIKSNDLTIKELSEKFGFSTVCPIYKWMEGKSLPSIDNLVNLAQIFNCTIDDILIWSESEVKSINKSK